MKIYDEFCQLCNKIKLAEEGGNGCITTFEVEMGELLEFCKSKLPKYQSLLCFCFHDIIKGIIDVPWEVLGFCMHELRIEPFKKELEEIVTEYGPKTNGMITSALDSYNDDWEDRFMFKRYGRIDV